MSDAELGTLRRPTPNFAKGMARSRYLITEPDQPHFLTCTVMEWLPVFSRPEAVAILLASWRHLREHEGMQLFGYVVMENHLHFAVRADRLGHCLARFKSFTAKHLIKLLESQGAESMLTRLRFPGAPTGRTGSTSSGRRGSHAEMILGEEMLRQKLGYIHADPVRRGYVDRAEEWRWSSARNYAGVCIWADRD